MYFAPAFGGLLQKLASWTFKNCSATDADAATTTSTSPSLRCMRGPCTLARAARAWCGTGPRCGKFPMIGHGLGPGGSGSEGRVTNFTRRYMRIATAIVAKPIVHEDMVYGYGYGYWGGEGRYCYERGFYMMKMMMMICFSTKARP